MSYKFNRLCVMVVDDSELMRELMRTILENLGVGTVVSCSSAEKALKRLKEYEIDIIFCDWKMEPMDGLEFVEHVRDTSKSPNPWIPIIMMSGFTEEFRVRAALEAGISEFLAKPLTARAVYQRLVQVIENPRDFVQIEDYFGPDRRRRSTGHQGGERRSSS